MRWKKPKWTRQERIKKLKGKKWEKEVKEMSEERKAINHRRKKNHSTRNKYNPMREESKTNEWE